MKKILQLILLLLVVSSNPLPQIYGRPLQRLSKIRSSRLSLSKVNGYLSTAQKAVEIAGTANALRKDIIASKNEPPNGSETTTAVNNKDKSDNGIQKGGTLSTTIGGIPITANGSETTATVDSKDKNGNGIQKGGTLSTTINGIPITANGGVNIDTSGIPSANSGGTVTVGGHTFSTSAKTYDIKDPFKAKVLGYVPLNNLQIDVDGFKLYDPPNNGWLVANSPSTIAVDSTDRADIDAEIIGPSSISKTGTGTLILSHDNSYAGGTVLKEGILVANTSNALSSGPVTLQGGELCLGNTRILHVGNYTQNKGATLALRADSPTNHDQLVVNGNAKLGGTLLLLLEGEGNPSNFGKLGKRMTLITTQGLNESRFDSIQLARTSLERLFVNYDANNVYVTSQFSPIYPYAISRNAQALARNLDLFSNTGRNQNLFDSLADLGLQQVPVALEKLVPNQVFALSSIGLSVSRSQMRNLQGRLDDLNSGYASYGQHNANIPTQHDLPLAGVSTQTNFLMNKDQELWSFYIFGNGSFGRRNNENEVIGYDYGQGGTFIGADYHLNDKVYVGGAVSYTYTDASFHGDRGSLSTNSYFGHLYAAYAQPKGFNLISSLSFGDHEFDLRRRALTDTAHSQPQSREVDFQTQVSYNILLEPNFTVSPYAGLAYSAFWMEGFQEYNSRASLKISGDQTNSLRSSVGLKAKYEKPFTKGIRKASLEADLAWEHEYFDTQARGINAGWVGSGAPSFRVQGGRISPDTLISGVNLRLSITNLLSVVTGYNIAVNQDYVSHGFSVGLNLAF